MNLHWEICPFCLERKASIHRVWNNKYLSIWCINCHIDGVFTFYEISGQAEEIRKEIEFQLLSNTLVEIESDDGWIPGQQLTQQDIKNARE